MKLNLENKLRDKLVLDHIVNVIASNSDLEEKFAEKMQVEFGITAMEFSDWLAEIDVLKW